MQPGMWFIYVQHEYLAPAEHLSSYELSGPGGPVLFPCLAPSIPVLFLHEQHTEDNLRKVA